MIFGKLFKKQQDAATDQVDAPDESVQAAALPEEYSGDVVHTEKTAKKTKADKKNIALHRMRKSRSRRMVHTKRSFHRKGQRLTGEQVHIYDVIERPVITEKAANQSENGVYVFIVQGTANKHHVADAVEVLYGVRPKKVRIAQRPPKKKRVRILGREREFGMTAQKKKAYVFLREGDTIKLT